MSCIETKLEYLQETKALFRKAIDPDGTTITDKTPFRNYVNFIGTLTNNSTLSKTTITFGDAITITGIASGGVEPYQYTFLCKHSTESSWTTLTSYGTTSTRVWQPKKSGTYAVRTKVKDASGIEVIKDFDLTVNETE